MTYLVMECHPGYAVVLDQTGRFLKVANLNYQVGETVSFVIECSASEEPVPIKSLRRRRILLSAASLAACFLLVFLGTWHLCLTPYGAVRLQINPDLKLTVNRLDYVISADGLNDDGLRLLDGCQFRGQKLEQASDELADRAMEMGYLKEGGQIFLTLESSHENWIAKTEDRLLTELENHLNDTIAVTVSVSSEEPASAEPTLPEAFSTGFPDDEDAGSVSRTPDSAASSELSRFPDADTAEDDPDEDDKDERDGDEYEEDDDKDDVSEEEDEHIQKTDTDDDIEAVGERNDEDDRAPAPDDNSDGHDSDDSSDNDSDDNDSDDNSDDD